jgi:polyisoprenoid-binding protein YceI
VLPEFRQALVAKSASRHAAGLAISLQWSWNGGSSVMALQRWSIDPAHSRIGFHVRHLMISNVHGRFENWDGLLEFDPDDPTESRVAISIDAASIDTRELRRDAHLRSPEFFDVESHPTIAFETTEIDRQTLDDYDVAGNLTIRGITRSVRLGVSRTQVIVDQAGQQRIAFAVSGSISRKDFGLTWNFVLETGGVMVGDKVTIEAEIEAVKLPENRRVPDPRAHK